MVAFHVYYEVLCKRKPISCCNMSNLIDFPGQEKVLHDHNIVLNKSFEQTMVRISKKASKFNKISTKVIRNDAK